VHALLLASLLVALVEPAAHAQIAYPSRPVRILASEAGGSVDLVARSLAQRLSEMWGQGVVVENHGGASGIIYTEAAARAAADGYTLSVGHTGTLAINPSLFRKLPYDPLKSFRPVSLVLATPLIVTTHPALPAHSMAELIAAARARPQALSFGSAGSGTASHLAGEWFNDMAKVSTVHVPYRGTAPAITALVAGDVQFMFTAQASTASLVRAGKLRALAVTGARRSAEAPELPTVAETLPGFELVNWQGVLVPAGTPEAIVAKLNDDIRSALASADVRKRLTTGGAEIAADSPAQFGAFISAEMKKWASVIRAAGIKPD